MCGRTHLHMGVRRARTRYTTILLQNLTFHPPVLFAPFLAKASGKAERGTRAVTSLQTACFARKARPTSGYGDSPPPATATQTVNQELEITVQRNPLVQRFDWTITGSGGCGCRPNKTWNLCQRGKNCIKK